MTDRSDTPLFDWLEAAAQPVGERAIREIERVARMLRWKNPAPDGAAAWRLAQVVGWLTRDLSEEELHDLIDHNIEIGRQARWEEGCGGER